MSKREIEVTLRIFTDLSGAEHVIPSESDVAQQNAVIDARIADSEADSKADNEEIAKNAEAAAQWWKGQKQALTERQALGTQLSGLTEERKYVLVKPSCDRWDEVEDEATVKDSWGDKIPGHGPDMRKVCRKLLPECLRVVTAEGVRQVTAEEYGQIEEAPRLALWEKLYAGCRPNTKGLPFRLVV